MTKHFFFNRTRGFYCLSKPRFGQDNCLWEEKGRKHPNVNKTLGDSGASSNGGKF